MIPTTTENTFVRDIASRNRFPRRQAFNSASFLGSPRIVPRISRSYQGVAKRLPGQRHAFESDNKRSSENGRSDFSLVDTENFLAMDASLSWLVEGLLVRSQPCIIGAPRKTLKTTLCVALAVSLASGHAYLGHFAVPQTCRVGLISGESGVATLRETLLRICNSLSLDRDAIQRMPIKWGFDLPGLANGNDRRALCREIKANRLDVVMIDPIYLALLSRDRVLNMANLFDVGQMLQEITRPILDAGATPIIVHHTQKRPRSGEPLELQDLAFAGFQEFVRQWILISRREKYEPASGEHRLWLNAGGSAGFSGVWAIDINEGRLHRDFTGRIWGVHTRTEEEERSLLDERDRTKRNERDTLRLTQDCQTILAYLGRFPEGETRNGIITHARISKERARHAIQMLMQQNRVEPCSVERGGGRGGNRRYEAIRIVDCAALPPNDAERGFIDPPANSQDEILVHDEYNRHGDGEDGEYAWGVPENDDELAIAAN